MEMVRRSKIPDIFFESRTENLLLWLAVSLKERNKNNFQLFFLSIWKNRIVTWR